MPANFENSGDIVDAVRMVMTDGSPLAMNANCGAPRCSHAGDMTMVELGYAISSEEFRPNDLVRYARRAEETGFTFALISDHFHPWMDSQGQSPFVWSTLGAIAHATERLRVGTGVTCPLVRIHPVIIAQAAASVADMFEGRFFLGLGTGEALNEHITGEHWPPVSIRQEMLSEAVGIIRDLWGGDYVTFEGDYYTVENARIYTLPEQLPEIAIAASGPESAQLAAEIGDALCSTSPDADIVKAFVRAGQAPDRPRYGQLTVCWGEDEEAAKKTALEQWGYTALPGQLSQELALPLYFQQATQAVTVDMVAEKVVCGPDPERFRAEVQKFVDAGFSHIYLHQIGPDQEGFFKFAERELLPHFS